MKIIKTTFFLCLLFVFPPLNTLFSQNIDQVFNGKREVYFSFQIDSPKELHNLTRIISIDNVDITTVYAYANRDEFRQFLQMGYAFTLLPHPGEIGDVKMLDEINIRDIAEWDFYPTYQGYLDMMGQFASDYPDLCTIVEIATLNSGRKLLAAKISDNVVTREAEPQFLYSSSMHGDEITGYVLMLRLINYLLSDYGTDPRITDIVNNMEIWICPLANPDGTYAGGNNTVNGATRGNANDIDLNRNYPDPEGGPHPDGNPWQQETIAFMNFATEHDFVMGANFHGGIEIINYPWDTWARLAADDDWWTYVSYEFADTVHANSTGYFYGLGTGVTNGYAWYEIEGGRQDYMNYYRYCRESTIEISDFGAVPPNELPAHWEYLYRSFLNYMEQCTFGVRGIISDSLTGEPLKAKVIIEGHDMDSSHIYSSLPVGNYHRLLYAGTYDMTFLATGYYPKTISGVTVANRQATVLDVQLVPGSLIPDFYASPTVIPAGGSVNFFDQSFGNVTTWNWTFEGGDPPASSEKNPLVVYNTLGVYSVSLTISDGSNSETLVKTGYITVNLEFPMNNSTVTTCSGVFYDSGGSSANYGDNEDIIMSFQPVEAGQKLVFHFTEFDIEYDENCNYDWLKIYDGSGIEAPLIGIYCGTESLDTVEATNEMGALTFQFRSDNFETASGWSAEINCDDNIGLDRKILSEFLCIHPNPSDGRIYIEKLTGQPSLVNVTLIDSRGCTVYSCEVDFTGGNKRFEMDLSAFQDGLYYLVVNSNLGQKVQKVILN